MIDQFSYFLNLQGWQYHKPSFLFFPLADHDLFFIVFVRQPDDFLINVHEGFGVFFEANWYEGFLFFFRNIEWFFQFFKRRLKIEPDEFLVTHVNRPIFPDSWTLRVGLPFSHKCHDVAGYLSEAMFRPDYQIAKSFLISFNNFPIFIRLWISEFFQCKTTVSQFIRVDKVDVWAVSTVFQFFSLLLYIPNDVFIKIWWCTNLELLYFCIEESVNLVLYCSEERRGCSFEHDPLVGYQKINMIGILLSEVYIWMGVHLKRIKLAIAASNHWK